MPLNLIAKAVLTAANMALTMSRKIEGPRVDDLKFTSGDYGTPWPRVWGTRWVRAPVIWGKDLTEVKQRRKTKGGKYNEYTYFGSWAHGLAAHELAGIRRIKADGHLIYDASGAGPLTPFGLSSPSASGKGTTGGGTITDYMAFYAGTMDQEVDPAIQADVEAKHGEGSCPAYLGRSYVRFDMVPLEKFGNRIPQMEFEVVDALAPIIPSEQHDVTYSYSTYFNLRFSSDYSRIAWMKGSTGFPGDTGGVEVWDVAARAPMLQIAQPYPTTGDGAFGVYNDGTMVFVDNNNDHEVYSLTADGSRTLLLTASGTQYAADVLADGAGSEHWMTYSARWYLDGVPYDLGWTPNLFFRDNYGNIWVSGRTEVGTSTAHFRRLVTFDNTPGYLTEFTLTLPAVGAGSDAYAAAAGDLFVLRWDTTHYLVDPVTGTTTGSVSAIPRGSVYSARTVWANAAPGAGSIWLGNSEYDLLTGALIRTVSGVPAGSGGFKSVYDPINHALWLAEDGITIYFLDRLDRSEAVLSDVVGDVCALAGIDVTTIDASPLTQAIAGYSVTGGAGKDWLEPLLDIHDVDPRPHGFALAFLRRGSAAGATIDSDMFASSGEGAPLFSSDPTSGTDLAAQVTLQFADLATEQQPNVAASPPLFAADSRRAQSLDLTTLALSASDARQLTGRYARRQRFDAKAFTLALTAREIALEPGDVRTLDLRGTSLVARLQSLVLGADRRIETHWRRDDPSIAELEDVAGATADGHDAAVLPIPLLSKGFVLDLPLLTDADSSSNPLVYLLAAPYGAGSWPGATIYEAVDGEYSDEVGSIPASGMAAWGHANGLLSAGDANLWDRVNTVNVTLQVGALSGCTEAAVDANPALNLALIGDELVNFTAAVLETDGTYTLSGFKRGRRGTEWACATHSTGDVFLLLAPAQDVERGLSEVGTNLSFKTISSGRTEGGAFPIALSPFTGASLKPYAPCHLSAVKQVSGDWALSWVRRTRVGGAWTGGTSIPLSENSEAYEVEVLNGSTVVRTIAGLSSPATTYSNASQVADFGSGQSSLHFRVYQISDAVARGFAAEATV